MRVRFWGLVRPGSGNRPARISVLVREGEWRQIARLQTLANGTFEIVVKVDPQRTFRLESEGRQGAPLNGAR